MAQFIQIPVARLEPETLTALLEEFASRDGTDYGLRESSLDEKTGSLKRQLEAGDLALVYDLDSEQYDLCARERLAELNL